MLAHIRNGEIIRHLQDGKGRVILENGDTVSPPVAGYENGADRIVPVVEEITDTSTTSKTRREVTETILADRVLRAVTISDVPVEDIRAEAQLDRFEFAMRAAHMGFVTYEEAAAWAAGNAMPAVVEAIVDNLPPEQKGPATVDVLARPIIRRTAGLMAALAAAFQTDDAGLDALFGIGADG